MVLQHFFTGNRYLTMNSVVNMYLVMNSVTTNILAIKNIMSTSKYVPHFHGATSTIKARGSTWGNKACDNFEYVVHFHGATSNLKHMGKITHDNFGTRRALLWCHVSTSRDSISTSTTLANVATKRNNLAKTISAL